VISVIALSERNPQHAKCLPDVTFGPQHAGKWPFQCHVTAADVQDRDALATLLKAVSRKSPWIELAFVDGGYVYRRAMMNGPTRNRGSFPAHIN